MGEGVKPIPKRWWWRKRLVPAVVIFLAGLVVARIWWGRYAERVLRGQVDAIRGRGEPLEWREFAAPPVADADNAAVLLRQAAECDFIAGQPADMDDGRYRRLESLLGHCFQGGDCRGEHRRDLDEIFEITGQARELCRRARGRRGCNWGIDFTGPALTAKRPAMAPYRTLGRVLTVAAMAAHDDGRDGEAVETLRDLLALGRAVGCEQSMIACLLEFLHRFLAAGAVGQMLPDLNIGPAPAAAPEQVRALMKELLDDGHMQRRIVRALTLERAEGYDTIERLRCGDLSVLAGAPAGKARLGWMDRLLMPMWQLDEARILRDMAQNILAAQQPTWPAAEPMVPVFKPPGSALEGYARMLSLTMVVAWDPAIKGQFIDRMRITMAGVGLAVRLYEHDHGRRPAKLEDLVDEYLPAVPPDRLTAGPDPIRYRLDGKGAIVYSVGLDGRDDGGDKDKDLVFLLDGIPPEKECTWRDPTTQPAFKLPFRLPR